MLLVLALAASLTAADLAHKALAGSPAWAYHPRGGGWYALTAAVVAGCIWLTRVPSRVVAVASGLLAGGAAGNALSAAVSPRGVPNPLVVRGESHVVAFNLADVFTVTGIVLLTSALLAVTVANRDRLLPPRRLRARLRRRR